MASTALNTRLTSASRIWLSTAAIAAAVRLPSSSRTSMATPRCCAMSLQRARVRSTTCRTSLLSSTGTSVHLRLAHAIELAHARDGLRHVVDRALDDLELSAAALGDSVSRSSSASVYSATGEIALLMSCAMPLAICPSARSRSCCMTCCCVWRRSS